MILTLPHGDLSTAPMDAVMTSTGKLLVGATVKTVQDESAGVVCRLTNVGELDTSFGPRTTAGCTRIRSPGPAGKIASTAHALAVRTDGSILIGGELLTPQGAGAAGIAAISENGRSKVDSFGSDGFVFFSGLNRVEHMQQAPGGSLVALIQDSNVDPTLSGNYLAKLDINTGMLRENFGEEGMSKIETGASDIDWQIVTGMDVSSSGAISVVGRNQNGDAESRAFVAKFSASGDLNPGFGDAGVVMFEHSSMRYHSLADVVSVGNDVVVAGEAETAPELLQWSATRLNAAGGVVANFGTAGEATVPLFHSAEKVDMQGARIVVSGASSDELGSGSNVDFHAIRLDHGMASSFAVFPQAGPGGTIQPAAQVVVGHSNVAEFKISPKPGFRIANVAGCGNAERIGSRYRTGPITSACVVSATFEKIPLFP